jgi:hypothetical protein
MKIEKWKQKTKKFMFLTYKINFELNFSSKMNI